MTGEPSDADAALRMLARVLQPYLRELDDQERNGAEFVDVVKVVAGPKRTLMAACRTGKIEGAVKVGRRWVAPRAAIKRWLQKRGPRAVPQKGDDLAALRRRLARS